MGMDVYGINPVDERGEYFRNNVWYWHPLWDFVTGTWSELFDENFRDGHTNSGYEVSGELAGQLAELIDKAHRSGMLANYENSFNITKANAGLVRCKQCDGAGIRTDEIGIRDKMPDRELGQEMAAITGRSHGWCNGCDGLGKHAPTVTWYNFEVENVLEFAEFAKYSGGFRIL